MVKTRNQLLLLALRADKDESQREEKFCKDSPISAPELVQYQITTQNTKKTKKENHEMKNKDNNYNNNKKKILMTTSAHFIGSPFSPIEAVERWPHRYSSCHNSDIKSVCISFSRCVFIYFHCPFETLDSICFSPLYDSSFCNVM